MNYTQILLGAIDPHFVMNGAVVGLSILKFLFVSLFGSFVGILGGVLATLLTAFNRKLQHHKSEIAHGHYHGITIVIGFSFLAYFVAESTYSSGIIAILFCGIVMNQRTKPLLSPPVRQTLDIGLHVFSQMCESLVFLYLGIDLVIYTHHFNWGLIFIANILILSLRMVIVFTISTCSNCVMHCTRRRKFIPTKDIFIHAFSGIRGAIAFALAFMIPHAYFDEEHKGEIVTASFSVILFTIFFQGTLNGSLIGILGIEKKKKTISEFVEDLQKMLIYLTKMSLFLPPYQTRVVDDDDIDIEQKKKKKKKQPMNNEEELEELIGRNGNETFVVLDGTPDTSFNLPSPQFPPKKKEEEEELEEGGRREELNVSEILGESEESVISSPSESEEEEEEPKEEKKKKKEGDNNINSLGFFYPPQTTATHSKITKIITGPVPSCHPVFQRLFVSDFLENYEKLKLLLDEYEVKDEFFYKQKCKEDESEQAQEEEKEKAKAKEEEEGEGERQQEGKKKNLKQPKCNHHRWMKELEECPCDDLLPTEDVRRKSFSIDLDESGKFYRLLDGLEEEEEEEGEAEEHQRRDIEDGRRRMPTTFGFTAPVSTTASISPHFFTPRTIYGITPIMQPSTHAATTSTSTAPNFVLVKKHGEDALEEGGKGLERSEESESGEDEEKLLVGEEEEEEILIGSEESEEKVEEKLLGSDEEDDEEEEEGKEDEESEEEEEVSEVSEEEQVSNSGEETDEEAEDVEEEERTEEEEPEESEESEVLEYSSSSSSSSQHERSGGGREGEEEIVIKISSTQEEEEEEERVKTRPRKVTRSTTTISTAPTMIPVPISYYPPQSIPAHQQRYLFEGIPFTPTSASSRTRFLPHQPSTTATRIINDSNFFNNHKNVSSFLEEQKKRNKMKNRSATNGKYIVISGGQKNLKKLILNLKKYVSKHTHQMEEIIMDPNIVESQRKIIQNYQRDLAFEIESLFSLEDAVLKDVVEKKRIHQKELSWFEKMFSRIFYIF